MKKSLVAMAVALWVPSLVNAATVYDKDGTSLKLDGRVQALVLSGNNAKAGDKDNTLQNSARFGIGGTTKLSFVKLTAYSQWDMADGSSKTGDAIKGRDQYLQADFGKYGAIKAGRFKGAATYVGSLTDVYEDYGCNAQSANDERNAGRIEYSFSANGFDLKLGGLLANDSYKLENGFKDNKSTAVNSGATIAAGYTFSDVPAVDSITIRAAYEYIDGQNDVNPSTNAKYTSIDSVSTTLAGVGVGDVSNGFYTAIMYNARTFKFNTANAKDLKTRGFEWAVGYAFDCGLRLTTGYDAIKYEQEETKLDFTLKSIPVYANYNVTPNFNLWIEGRIDATSEDDMKGLNTFKINAPYLLDKNYAEIGARYTF